MNNSVALYQNMYFRKKGCICVCVFMCVFVLEEKKFLFN